MNALKNCLRKTSAYGLSLALVCLLSAPAVALAQNSSMMGGSMMNGNGMKMNHTHWNRQREEMMRHHRQMMKMRQKFQEQIKKQNAELQKLVKKMDNANGPKKTDLMAKLLTKLVHDRVALNNQMSRMPFPQAMGEHHPMMEMSQNDSWK